VELLQALEQDRDPADVAGLMIRTPDGPRRTTPREPVEDLDVLPLPAWHLLPDYVTTYQPTASRRTRLPSAYIVTSRGCPFKCTFCNNVVHGRRFRSYSVDYIMSMVTFLVREYGIRDLTIYDENLALQRKRIDELCRRLKESQLDLTWSCDARADCIDDELAALMYEAGCRAIWFGMESGNADVLKRYRKALNLEDLEQATRLCKKHGINACGSFIIAGPTETPATIKDTIRFAKRIPLAHFVPIFYTPVPGTSDYPQIAEHGSADLNYRSATMTRVTFVPDGMTVGSVYYWYVRAMLSWYGRPRVLWQFVRHVGPLGLARTGMSFLWQGCKAILGAAVGRRKLPRAAPSTPSQIESNVESSRPRRAA